MHTAALTDELVEAAAQGDLAHRNTVLSSMNQQVRSMIIARLHPTSSQSHLVDDLVQETMTALSASLPSLQRRNVAGLRAFASTIAARTVAHALQRRGVFGKAAARSLDSTIKADDPSVQGPLWNLLSASGASPLTEIDRAAHVHEVLAKLHELKPEHREVITLAFFDQLETRDIAEHLGISRPAASMLLVRAVNTLRRNLTGTSRVEVRSGPDGRANV